MMAVVAKSYQQHEKERNHIYMDRGVCIMADDDIVEGKRECVCVLEGKAIERKRKGSSQTSRGLLCVSVSFFKKEKGEYLKSELYT